MKNICVTLLFWVLFTASAWGADSRIGILVFDGVLSSDVTAPAEVFGVASNQAWFDDYDVVFIGVEAQPTVTTEEGLVLNIDHDIGNAPALDALIVPSRYSMKPLLENAELTAFIRSQGEDAEWLGSNCSGAFLLANAGLLDGVRATTWAGGEKGLQRQFPDVQVVDDQNVVVDGNITTSNGSVVSYQAALVMLAQMSSESRAEEVFEALQLNRLMAWSDVAQFIP